MSGHIIGRPDDDLMDIMLGDGADPEQGFIRGSEPRREKAHEDEPAGDEPPADYAAGDCLGWGMHSSSYSAMTISPASGPQAGHASSRRILKVRKDSSKAS